MSCFMDWESDWCTGQVSAAWMSCCFCLSLYFPGIQNFRVIFAIRRGASADICLLASKCIPLRSIFIMLACIPIMVIMQAGNEAVKRSVGEKLSPFP